MSAAMRFGLAGGENRSYRAACSNEDASGLANTQGVARAAQARVGIGVHGATGAAQMAQQGVGVDADAVESAACQARFDHGRSQSDSERAHAKYIQRKVSGSGVTGTSPIRRCSLALLPARVSTSFLRTKAGLTRTSMR